MAKKYPYNMDREEFKKQFGSYNDSPPNFKEISEKEFAQSKFFTYDSDYREYRQITNFGDKCIPIQLYYFFDQTGYGMSSDYWNGKVRYFQFSKCEHEYRELSVSEARQKGQIHHGNCYHVYECVKCGYIIAQDSSG